jgi:hypothetical protein
MRLFFEHCVPADVLAKLPHCSEGHLEPAALCEAIMSYGCPICRGFVVLMGLGFSAEESVDLLKVKAKMK